VSGALRVLLDATSIPAEVGGVGRYLEALIPALATAGDGSEEIELYVVCQARDAGWLAASAPAAHIVPLADRYASRVSRLLWEQVGLPGLARRLGADVIHSPHYTRPLLARRPVVVTLHDATFFSHPELHSRLKRAFFRTWIRSSHARAAGTIVPSDATKSEVERFAPRGAAPIAVAHHAVDPAVFHQPSPEELAAAAAHLNVASGSWIAFLGTIEPRKNVANLIRAYASLAVNDALPPLLIAGARGWDSETAGLVEALPSGVDVRLVGYLPEELLAGFLGGSRVFAYPSTDPASIAAALDELLHDDVERASLVSKALLRAKSFTWAATAALHVAAYAKAAHRKAVRA
jgi:glycosyltransferase involved in cell wall biosynthesis